MSILLVLYHLFKVGDPSFTFLFVLLVSEPTYKASFQLLIIEYRGPLCGGCTVVAVDC